MTQTPTEVIRDQGERCGQHNCDRTLGTDHAKRNHREGGGERETQKQQQIDAEERIPRNQVDYFAKEVFGDVNTGEVVQVHAERVAVLRGGSAR